MGLAGRETSPRPEANKEIRIMRYVFFALSAFVVLGTAGVAVAGPPKSTILHCGSIDSCFDGVDIDNDVVRTGSDCQLSGPPLGDPIDACEMQDVGQVCGALVID
jgi:hypothetical protein